MSKLKVQGSTIYELNSSGVNKWSANINAGFDENGYRFSEDECERIAKKLALSDEMALALETLGELMEAGAFPEDYFDKHVEPLLEKIRGEL